MGKDCLGKDYTADAFAFDDAALKRQASERLHRRLASADGELCAVQVGWARGLGG